MLLIFASAEPNFPKEFFRIPVCHQIEVDTRKIEKGFDEQFTEFTDNLRKTKNDKIAQINLVCGWETVLFNFCCANFNAIDSIQSMVAGTNSDISKEEEKLLLTHGIDYLVSLLTRFDKIANAQYIAKVSFYGTVISYTASNYDDEIRADLASCAKTKDPIELKTAIQKFDNGVLNFLLGKSQRIQKIIKRDIAKMLIECFTFAYENPNEESNLFATLKYGFKAAKNGQKTALPFDNRFLKNLYENVYILASELNSISAETLEIIEDQYNLKMSAYEALKKLL